LSDKNLEIKDTLASFEYNKEINEKHVILAREQDLDPQILQMKNYLKDETLPESENDKRKILLTNSQFYLDPSTNILYRLYFPNPKSQKDLFYVQLVLPCSMIREILRNVHDVSYMGAHMSTEKTYLKLIPYVYFNKMY